jgi:hypothetical protein
VPLAQGSTLDQLARAVAYCMEERENGEAIAKHLGVKRRTLALYWLVLAVWDIRSP